MNIIENKKTQSDFVKHFVKKNDDPFLQYINRNIQQQKKIDIFDISDKLQTSALILGKNGSGKSNFCCLTAPFNKTMYVSTEENGGGFLSTLMKARGLIEYTNWYGLTNFSSACRELKDECVKKGIRVLVLDSLAGLCNILEGNSGMIDPKSKTFYWDIAGFLAKNRMFLSQFLTAWASIGISVYATCPIDNQSEPDLRNSIAQWSNGAFFNIYTIKNIEEDKKSNTNEVKKFIFSNKDRGIFKDLNPEEFFKSRKLTIGFEDDVLFDEDVYKEYGIISYGIYSQIVRAGKYFDIA